MLDLNKGHGSLVEEPRSLVEEPRSLVEHTGCAKEEVSSPKKESVSDSSGEIVVRVPRVESDLATETDVQNPD